MPGKFSRSKTSQMSVGHRAVPLGDVGAVAEGRREDDLRDVAVVDQAVAEVGGRRRAVGAGREHRRRSRSRRARPSSQRRWLSGPSTSTRSQVTLPASFWARSLATASFELSSQVNLVPVSRRRARCRPSAARSGRRRPRTRRSSRRRSSRRAGSVLRAGRDRQDREGGGSEKQSQVHSVSPCGSSRSYSVGPAPRAGRSVVSGGVERAAVLGRASRPSWRRRPAARRWPTAVRHLDDEVVVAVRPRSRQRMWSPW